MRIGACVLSLFAVPLNGAILQALSGGPIRFMDLRRRTGSPPQTTLRGRLRALSDIGALAGGREEAFPGAAGYELTPAGRDLLRVAHILQGWLWSSPNGALPLVSDGAKAAVKALVEGWLTSMLRVLGAGSFSLTQMDGIISGLNYPSLERRLTAMRLAGQVEAMPSRGRGTPYAATEWLRRATAPLAAAMWWEHRYLQEEAPAPTDRDIETLFLLGIPLLRLPKELSGSCRLAVELSRGERGRLAGAMVEVDGGSVAFCSSRIEGYPDAWVVAPVGTWLATMIERRSSQMEMGGDGSLADGILQELQQALFSSPSLPDPRPGSNAPNGNDNGTDPCHVPTGTRGKSSHGESRENVMTP